MTAAIEGERDRLARVRAVVRVARLLADGAHPLGARARERLCATSGLSAEGVELVLSEHLETEASDADLAALLTSAGTSERCDVILSAQVPTAALRASALATATAPRVRLRPSRRDPDVAEMVATALTGDPAFAAAGGHIEVATRRDGEPAPLDLGPGDELHAYGSDETLTAIAASAPAGVVVHAHGTGLGVAIVGAGDDLASAARGVARDVVPFDQRGCLSPRFVLVEATEHDAPSRADAFARALDEALGKWGSRVPRGPLDEPTRAAIALYAATSAAVGAWHEGPHHGVGVDPSPRALVLPPAARVVHVTPVDAASFATLFAPWRRFVTTLGGGEASALLRAARAAVPAARTAELGRMQRPPLDGPVDRRAPS